jgi:hypothetical protein
MRRYSRLSLLIILTLLATTFLSCGRNNANGNRDRETNIRFLNAVSDVESLDFFLDFKLYLPDVGYLENSQYDTFQTGAQKLQVNINGTGTRLVDTTIGLSDRRDTTIIVAGRRNNATLITARDDNDPASSSIAKIRFINLAFAYNKLDLYIVNAGGSIDTLAPTYSNINYKSVGNYLVLDKGNYSVILTVAGSKTPIAQIPNTYFDGAAVYSLLAVDAKGGNGPAGLLLLTDKK